MISFVAGGYIEVTRNGAVLSRHRLEREAIESCTKHGPGVYVLTYPSVRVVVEGTETGAINGAALIAHA